MRDKMKDGRGAKKLCVNCRERRALYQRRGGAVRWGRGFDLCFRCHRSLADSMRAQRLAFAEATREAMPAVQTEAQLPLAA